MPYPLRNPSQTSRRGALRPPGARAASGPGPGVPPGEGVPAGEAGGVRMANAKVVGALAAGTATRRARARWVRVRSGASAYGAEVVSTSSSPEDVPAPDVRPAGLSVVVIPGNPGTAEFYAEFVEGLQEQLGPGANVLAVGHRGHQAAGPEADGREPFVLADQIAHHEAFLRDRLRGDVALVGHSIGAHIALQCAKQLAAAGGGAGAAGEGPTVRKVVGLQPYLQFDPRAGVQRRLDWVTWQGGPLSLLAYPLRAVPLAWRAALVKAVEGPRMGGEAAELVARLAGDRGFVQNAFAMGQSEFRALRGGIDIDFIAGLAGEGRAAFVYSEADHWAPLREAEALRERGVPVTTVTDAEHGFVVDPAGTAAMVGHTAALLRGL